MNQIKDVIPPALVKAAEAQAAKPAAPVVTAEQLELVKRTVAAGATAQELQLYLYDCVRQNVHPLDRLLHFTKRAGKYTPVTSIDLMRIRAAETGEYAGSDDPVFAGPFDTAGGVPSTASVTVWRLVQGTRCAFTATARWSEYKPEQNDFMWKKMPYTMLGKCAEALALRKGFPRQLAGLYAREEMDQVGKPDEGYVVEAPAVYPKADVTGHAVSQIQQASETKHEAIPAGPPSSHITIQRVEKARGAVKARVIFSTGQELPIFDARLAALAEALCQEGCAVDVDIAASATSKREYIRGLKRQGAVVPVVDDIDDALATLPSDDDAPPF